VFQSLEVCANADCKRHVAERNVNQSLDHNVQDFLNIYLHTEGSIAEFYTSTLYYNWQQLVAADRLAVGTISRLVKFHEKHYSMQNLIKSQLKLHAQFERL
jgi:hypothetical protein